MIKTLLKIWLLMMLMVLVVGFAIGCVATTVLAITEGPTPLLVFTAFACFAASCMSVEVIRKELDL